MAKIPRYNPQIQAAVEPDRSFIGERAQIQSAQALQQTAAELARFGGTMSEIGDALRREQDATDFANARAEYNSWAIGWMDDAAETAGEKDSDGHYRYLSMGQRFNKESQELAERLREQFQFGTGQEQFDQWLSDKTPGIESQVRQMSREKWVEHGMASLNRNLSAAEAMGNTEEIGRLVAEGVTSGLLTPGKGQEVLDQVYPVVYQRGLIQSALRLAHESGDFNDGMALLTSLDILDYEVEGREYRLNLQQVEQLQQKFRADWDRARQEELRARREGTYSMLDQYYPAALEGRLDLDFVLYDDRFDSYDGQPFDLRQLLSNLAMQSASGAEEHIVMKQQWEDLLMREFVEFVGTQEEWARHVMSLYDDSRSRDDDGNFLHALGGMPPEIAESFRRRAPHQFHVVTEALDALDSARRSNLSRVTSEPDGLAVLNHHQRYRQAHQALENIIQSTMAEDIPRSEKERLINDAAGSLSQWILNEEFYDELTARHIDPYTPVRGRNPRHEALILQQAIQEGALTGMEEHADIRQQVLRLSNLYNIMVGEDSGLQPDGFDVMAGQQPAVFYTRSRYRQLAPGAHVERFGQYGILNADGTSSVALTYREVDGNLMLKIWNAQTERWELASRRVQQELKAAGIWENEPHEVRPLGSRIDEAMRRAEYQAAEEAQRVNMIMSALRGAERNWLGSIKAGEHARIAEELGIPEQQVQTIATQMQRGVR